MAYSVIIKNGTIIDGTGSAPFAGDIGIKKDVISKIGDLSQETADFVFDAAGLTVSPGFIDITNHSDVYGTIFYASLQESLLTQGISTILLGNCGESLAPLAKIESLSGLERWTNLPINADWNSVEEYFKSLEKNGIGVNCATLVGQETLLRNSDDPKGRLFLLEKSLEEGALGLSSNFSFHYLTEILKEETKIFLKKIKKANGIYKIHLRDEGKDFLPAVAFAVELARQSGVLTVISHFKAVGKDAWADFLKAINIIEIARKDGVNVSFDVFPYLRTGSHLIALLPLWAKAGDMKDIVRKLSDLKSLEHILDYLRSITLHSDRILIASAFKDKNIVGKSLKAISEDYGKSPEETIIEILKANNLNVTIFGRSIFQENLITAIKKEYSCVSSDGAGYNLSFEKTHDFVHPRSFGAFPRFISKIARSANLTLEEAVKKVTSIPAAMLGLENRGILKKNFIADINVFDSNNFKDASTYLNPYKYSSGVRCLLISGDPAFLDGQFLGKFGRIIKKA